MSRSLFVKICGLTRAQDVAACVAAGVDAIGLNFWSKSPRAISLEAARELVRDVPASIKRVGVFVDPDADEVRRVRDAGVIDLAQLHGDEDSAFCTSLGFPFWKALRLADGSDLDRLRVFGGELLLVDAASPHYGGSGQRIAVDIARRAAQMRPIVLAGGLTPDNVAEAVCEVKPFGVDVASGVELTAGIKDPARIAAFVTAARSAL